jgi:hypothetical protein
MVKNKFQKGEINSCAIAISGLKEMKNCLWGLKKCQFKKTKFLQVCIQNPALSFLLISTNTKHCSCVILYLFYFIKS